MPIEILTFWKSTWGTRMTTNDVQYMEKKKKSRKNKHGSGEGTDKEKEKKNI